MPHLHVEESELEAIARILAYKFGHTIGTQGGRQVTHVAFQQIRQYLDDQQHSYVENHDNDSPNGFALLAHK